jgi:hypothetical protein
VIVRLCVCVWWRWKKGDRGALVVGVGRLRCGCADPRPIPSMADGECAGVGAPARKSTLGRPMGRPLGALRAMWG